MTLGIIGAGIEEGNDLFRRYLEKTSQVREAVDHVSDHMNYLGLVDPNKAAQLRQPRTSLERGADYLAKGMTGAGLARLISFLRNFDLKKSQRLGRLGVMGGVALAGALHLKDKMNQASSSIVGGRKGMQDSMRLLSKSDPWRNPG